MGTTEYNKRWRLDHPDYGKQWRKKNYNYGRNYYLKNKERILLQTKKYALEHPEIGKKARSKYWKSEKGKLHQKQNAKNYYQRLKKVVFSHYSDPIECSCCKEKELAFLCLDHINGGGNKHRKEVGYAMRMYQWIKNNNYPKGFRILCANCNMAVKSNKICPHQKIKG